MLEYKRKTATLEADLRDVQKRALYHDDHLRIVDAWWSQLLDEVTLLSGDRTSAPPVAVAFPTALQFKGSAEFSEHLNQKAKEIRAKVAQIFSNISNAAPADVEELQRKLSDLMAEHREMQVKFDRLRAEKEELGERLETASLRYLKAEKRLDRNKSAAVAKLEQQAYAGTGNAAGSGIGGVENGFDSRGQVNGVVEDDGKLEAAQLALKEATATVNKQKEQLDALLAENKSLLEQLTAANSKLLGLTDEDYARTDLFKTFKAQHEEVIKRINHLEATNIQLRREAEQLQAERTAYKSQIKSEAENLTGEIESQLERTEADLSRVRSGRDEIIAELTMRKASQEQERTAVQLMKEMVGAKDDRIEGLEAEVQRLRSQLEAPSSEQTSPDIESLDLTELRKKYVQLEQSFASVNNELPAMEKAYKRSMAMASKKVMDFDKLEDKVSMLIAEKSKADQKYFAARKDMDIRSNEIRALRAQNAKSSEIITQLKEVEGSTRTLLAVLEKQMSELRLMNESLAGENKKLSLSAGEANSRLESLKSQVSELSNLMRSKDATVSSAKQQTLSLETELEQLRIKYEHAQKEKAQWKAKSLANGSTEEENLRVSQPFAIVIYIANMVPATRSLHRLQGQLQGHGSQNVRSCVLPPMRGGSHEEPYEEMSQLRQGL
jgi:E3 ubiquitin-protein ligase BRE1